MSQELVAGWPQASGHSLAVDTLLVLLETWVAQQRCWSLLCPCPGHWLNRPHVAGCLAALRCCCPNDVLTICSLMTLPSSSTVRIFCNTGCHEKGQALQAACQAAAWKGWRRNPTAPTARETHEVNADGRDVALCVSVILQTC